MPLFDGAVAQVDRDAGARIGDVHNRVLSPVELVSKRIGRGETALPIVAGTYATAPDDSASFIGRNVGMLARMEAWVVAASSLGARSAHADVREADRSSFC